jgi:hypothetical protein
VELGHRGPLVDLDTTDGQLLRAVKAFADCGGNLGRLTVSTDAGQTTPAALPDQFACCAAAGWPLEQVLALAHSNGGTEWHQLRQSSITIRSGSGRTHEVRDLPA